MNGGGLHTFDCLDASCTCVDTDHPVLLEDPVKNVVIVADSADPANHQFPALGAEVGLAHFLMLVFRSRIAFEYRHRAGDIDGRSGIVSDGRVNKHRVLRRVLARLDLGGESPHAVVSGIEIGFEVPAHVRISIGHDHAAQVTFVHDFALLALIVIGDRGNHRAYPRIQCQMQVPVLPVDAVAGDRVVLALGFDDLQWLDGRRLTPSPVVRRRLHWHRHYHAIFDLDHALGFQVDHGHQVFDRMSPVVTIADIQIADHLKQTLVLNKAVFAIKVAHCERRSDDLLDVFDATFGQRLSIFSAAFYDRLHGREVVQQDHPVNIPGRFPTQEFFAAQIYHGFDDVPAIKYGHIGFARLTYGFSGIDEVPDFALLRPPERYCREPEVFFIVLRRFDHLDRQLDFVCTQSVKWMRPGFDAKRFIQARLEYFIDEVIRHKCSIFFKNHRNAKFQSFAVKHRHFAVRFYLDICPVFGNNEEVGIVVPFYSGPEIFQGRLQGHHLRCAAMGMGGGGKAGKG